MPITLYDALSFASRHLPEGVSYSSIKNQVHGIAAAFHSCCSSYYLEWHPTAPTRCDLLCSLLFENGSLLHRRLLSGKLTTTDQRWKVLTRFLGSWDAINVKLDGLIPHIWLACDFDTRAKHFSPPNVHFCLDRQFIDRSRLSGYLNRLTEARFNRAVDTVMKGSFRRIPHSAVTSIRNCFHALDAGGEILHLSFMHGRTPPVFKLNCTVPKGRVETALMSLEWQGDRTLITKLCDEFAPDEKRIKCNICMNGTLRNRFELELEYNSPLRTDPRRKPMLASLFRRGLVTREQIRDLLEWPGETMVPAGTAGKKAPFERWLDIKICVDEKSAVTAKAYLGFAVVLPRIGW